MRAATTSALLLLSVAALTSSAFSQAVVGPQVQRDVFVVGADTAIGDPLLDFKPTRVEFTQEPMDISGRRELVRMLLMEQGFAHRALPLGAPGLVLHANGKLTVDSKTLQARMYKDGMCAGAGDRIMVTDIAVLADRINIDVNGGPYLPHRFLRHISINNMPLAGDGQVGERPTGTRITLLFEGATPRLSAAELKSLLEPLLDFGLKSSEQAFADTLPEPIKKAIEEHEVYVGMNRRMVLASLGQPESKLRERAADSTDGEVFEEWIYGHTPQTIRFVRFRGDRVVLMKTAALGKAIEINDKDQMAGYRDPALTHEISLGDAPLAAKGTADSEAAQPKAPSLRAPGERPDAEKGKASPAPTPDPAVKKSLASNAMPHLM
ncbi:DUF2845 domain-containing protein [Terriglobus roseus]|nr:DUF2845 domain-containing protein [Terriglobus roseus]